MSFRTAATLLCAAAFFPCVIDALPSSLMPDGTVIHGGQPFFPLGLYAENEVMPWDVVPALEPAMTGQQLAQRLAKAGWNAIVDYGVGTAGNTPQPDLIREFYDGMHAVGMNVIANLDDAVAGPLNPKMWGRNTTDQAIELLLAAVVDHPAMLAIAYSTEGGMMSFGSAKNVTANLKRIQDVDGGGRHVIANLGAIPLDSVTYRNDLGAEFCPPDILAHPEKGCMWNGPPCGGGDGTSAAATVCGPDYFDIFDDVVPAPGGAAGVGGDEGGQYAFGAQQYGFPASPEAFNATCQRAQWSHLPNNPCMNQSTNGFRDPAQEGQDCIHGSCWGFGYDTQMMNLSASNCPGKIGAAAAECNRAHRHSVWTTPTAFSWATSGWRDPDGPADGPCVHWNMDVADFPAPSAAMMSNIAWQSVANGANGLVFYSLMDNLRPLCCHGVVPKTAHGCNESLPAAIAEANIHRLESFAGQFMKHNELLVGETLIGAVTSAVIVNTTTKTNTTAWPNVQSIVKRPRGVAKGTNTTATTLVVVNAMNATLTTVLAVEVDGVHTDVRVTLPPHVVHFAPL